MAKIGKERISNIVRTIKTSESLRMLIRNTRFVVGVVILLGLVLFGCIGPIFYPRNPLSTENPSLRPLSPEYPLGTDMAGKDILAALMYGIRTSLYVGFLAAGIATILGVVAATFQ